MTYDAVIWIESTRDRDAHGNACLLKWQGRERYVPVADVRATAEDLFTCAAYADFISELLKIGLPGPQIVQITQGMLHKRKPRHFGTPNTLYAIPAGSSARKTGAVLIAARDRFHQGQADGQLSPDEARAMGRHWLAAAEASEADTLFSAVLENSGWMEPIELDALFSLLNDIRGGKARVPPAKEDR